MDAIASEIHEGNPAIIAVAGTKGTGKSGFARLMVNTLLNTSPKVAYLDTDLGQPEFTVPGEALQTRSESELVVGNDSVHNRGQTPCKSVSENVENGLFKRQTDDDRSLPEVLDSGGQDLVVWQVSKPCTMLVGLASLHLLDSPIMGPPHMHQRAPEACQYLGDMSPQGEPLKSAQAVKHLFQWFVSKLSGNSEMLRERLPPMVVNTHGWIQVIKSL